MGRTAGRYRRLRATDTLENWLPGALIKIAWRFPCVEMLSDALKFGP